MTTIDWDSLLAGGPDGNAHTRDEPGVLGDAERPGRYDVPASGAPVLPGIASPERAGDDRRRCLECAGRAANGRCLAAARGELVASRSYTPNPERLQRCKCFAPLPDDPDQRPGRDRWPGL